MSNFAILKKTTLAIISIVLLGIQGCNDRYFEIQPDNILTIDEIFKNRGQTERWWAGLFTNIPDVMHQSYTLTSDEADASNWGNPGLNSGNPGAPGFQALYERIRLASIFLERIDENEEIKTLVNGAELIRHYKGEARFLRAYYYWLMLREMGPVVIVPLTPATPEDDLQLPRSSWDECVDFLINELALAKQDLPVDYYLEGTNQVDGTQVGRINQLIANALESQILLYHASPLYNGNTAVADFRNLDGKQLISQAYDANRWNRAAVAAKAAIDLAAANGKQLFKAQDGDPFRAAYLSVRNLYWDGWRVEGIWLRPSTSTFDWEISCAPRSIQGTAYNGYAVVQGLVDAFRMNDGTSIAASSSYREDTYADASTDYYVAGTNQMHVAREARYYAYITFNGALNPGVAKAGAANARVEFFNTGTSGKAGAPRDWPKTGYTIRKNIHPTFSVSPQVTVDRPAMLMRMAELYLNYAEALNEADPGHADVLTYLNAVRTRAGLPALLPGISQAALREAIRLERRLELCFEGHRYFDVRRWKIADQPGSNQGGEFYGMNMDAGTHLSDPEFHTRTVAFRRAAWQRRFYFMPYGQNEMDRNKQLVQFPGY